MITIQKFLPSFKKALLGANVSSSFATDHREIIERKEENVDHNHIMKVETSLKIF